LWRSALEHTRLVRVCGGERGHATAETVCGGRLAASEGYFAFFLEIRGQTVVGVNTIVESMECVVDDCEREKFLGRAGTCDNVTGVCVCPDGYWGNDDWSKMNSCHVPVDVQRGLWMAVIASASLTVLLGLGTLFYLSVLWDFVRIKFSKELVRTDSASTGTTRMGGDSDVSRRRSGNEQHQPLKKQKSFLRPPSVRTAPSQRSGIRMSEEDMWHQQRNTLFAVLLLVLYGLGVLAYAVPFFFDQFRFQHNWYQNLGLSIAFTCYFCGLWTLVYVWYRTLPSLKSYADLFELNSFIIDYPVTVRWVSKGYGLICFVTCITCVFIVPLIAQYVEEAANLQDALVRIDDVFLALLLFLFLLFVVFYTTLLVTLKKLFGRLKGLVQEAERATQSQVLQDEKSKIRKTLRTVNAMLIAHVAMTPTGVVFMIMMTFTDAGRENVYFWLNLIAIMASHSAMLGFYVFVFRMGSSTERQPGPSNEAKTVITNRPNPHSTDFL